jgi:uncharacterized protein (TIGR03437 family)
MLSHSGRARPPHRLGVLLVILAAALCFPGSRRAQEPQVYRMYITHAASFDRSGQFAPGTICAAFGDFPGAPTLHGQSFPLPTTLGGFRMTIGEIELPLFFVSATQVNFLIPPQVPISDNLPELTLTYQDRTYVRFFDHFGTPIRANIQTVAHSPGLFTADSSGLGIIAGQIAVWQNERLNYLPICNWQTNDGGTTCQPAPLPNVTPRYLIIYGTGLGQVAPGEVHCVLNFFTELPVLYAGPSPDFVGLDQYNVLLPDGIAAQFPANHPIPISIYVDKQRGFQNPRSQLNTHFAFGALP